MGLFSSSKKEKTIAIFDIGSGSVGGAIVDIPLKSNAIPVIKKIVRTDIKSSKTSDLKTFIKDMTSALNETANSLYNKKGGAPEEIMCVLSSPWYLSAVREIKINREKPFVFTARLADDLIQKELLGINKQYEDKYGEVDSKPEMIEHYAMSVFLNGYFVDDPIGKKCKNLEIDMIISLAPKICLDSIRETLSRTFHDTRINFSSFTLSTYLAVREKYISPLSYLLIDVGSEVTDVGVVSKGILKSTLSFPFGKKTFLNSISKKLKMDLRDVEEIIGLHNDKNLETSRSDKFEPVLKSVENSWLESFNKCVNSLPHSLILPNTIFLTADKDIINKFADIFRNEKSSQTPAIDNKCDVITLDTPMLLDACKVNEGNADPFLIIESIAAKNKTIK
ncbi:MAG TPA: hypothetical protein VK153_01995 [Candidatus Paceibacterota bacterium]|nr:hypothetical protein [Candidatus Paceibacterota bacterium]